MATTYENPVYLDELDGTGGFRFTYGADVGRVEGVATAGDVNGDGYDDVIITARPGLSNTIPLANYVVYGSADGLPNGIDLATLTAEQGFRLEAAAGSTLWVAQGGGDLNGDGYADIVVVSNNDVPFDYLYEDVNVIFGGQDFGQSFSLGSIDGGNGFTLAMKGNNWSLNWSANGSGDVNGDGIDDLVMGGSDLRVFYGTTASQPASQSLPDATQVVLANPEPFGGTGDIIGDINGDGLADMRYREAVVFGRADGFATPPLTVEDLDGSNGFRISTEGIYGSRATSSAGDVNGDGIEDFIIGAPRAFAHGHIEAGEAFVVFGREGGFDADFDLNTLDGTNGFIIKGETLSQLGSGVAGAGDVNGDGFDDVLVRSGYGNAYVVFGQATFHGSSFDASELDGIHGFRIDSTEPYENILGLAGLGDFNGDGFSDLAFTTNRGSDFDGDTPGAAIVYGRAPTGPVTLVDSDIDQTLRGGVFDDTLISYGGDDRLIGGDGDDSLRSFEGSDTMEGGLGDDEYFVFADHSDIIVDTGGNDTVRTTTHWDLTGYDGIENVVLSAAGDWHLRGNDLDNRLVGSFGDNVLEGGYGRDRLEGGAGADLLIGGEGRDVLIGGAGLDQFRFLETNDSLIDGYARDVILDYEAGELLNLGAVDANIHRNGNQAFNFIGNDEFSGRTGQLRYDTLTFTNGTVTTLVEGDVNGDGEADFAFEVRGVHTFTADDFIL